MMKTLKYFILFFFISSFAYATDYWVRPLGGSYGSEDGSDYDNAFDGFADTQTENDLAAGDTLIICGEHREGLVLWVGGSSENILYITGDCPDGTDGVMIGSKQDYSGSSWTNESGNIWYVTDADFIDSKFALFGSEVQSNVGIWEDAKLDLDAEREFWYDSGNTRYYVYTTNASGPEVAYSDGIELTSNTNNRGNCIRLTDYDYVDISDLEMKYYANDGVRIQDGNYIYVHDNVMKYAGGYNIPAGNYAGIGIAAHGDSTYLYFYNNDISQIFDAGIGPHTFNDNKTMQYVYVYDNVVDRCGHGINIQSLEGPNSLYQYAYVYNNIVTNSGYGWSGVDNSQHGQGISVLGFDDGVVDTVEVYNNIVDTYAWTGIKVAGVDNTGVIKVYSNIVRNGIDGYTNDPIALSVNGDRNQVIADFYYNLVYNNEGHGFKIYSNTSAVNIYNNTFYNNGDATFDHILSSAATSDVYKNNIIYSTDSICFKDASATQSTYNNNMYYRAVGDVWELDSTQYTTIATWRAATLQDADSNQGDPLFVSAGNDNYKLESNSPAVDDGEDLSLTEDLIGSPVPWGSAPDIGAYEWHLTGTVSGCTISGGVF